MIDFEYKEIFLQDELDMQFLDALSNFGWIIDESKTFSEKHVVLKRSRVIVNKMELIRLERNLLSCFKEIRNLNASSHTYATMISIIIGLVGFLIGLFAYFMYCIKWLFFMFLFALIGVLLIALAYPVYEYTKRKKEKKNNHFLDQKYEEIEIVCKKASAFFE